MSGFALGPAAHSRGARKKKKVFIGGAASDEWLSTIDMQTL
jgi:hypothetical protein